MRKLVLGVLAAGAAVGLFAARTQGGRGLSEKLLEAAVLAGELGWAGVALYAVGFVAGTLMFVPTASLDMAAGLLFAGPYGAGAAVLIALGSKLLACSAHFAMGQTFLRGYVQESVLPKFPIFEAVGKLVATDAFKVTCAVRFAPIPSVAKNLGCAALGVPYHFFLLVSALFSAPWTAAAVVAGSSLTSLAEILDGRGRERIAELTKPWMENPMITATVVVLGLAGFLYVGLAAKKAYADVVGAKGDKAA